MGNTCRHCDTPEKIAQYGAAQMTAYGVYLCWYHHFLYRRNGDADTRSIDDYNQAAPQVGRLFDALDDIDADGKI